MPTGASRMILTANGPKSRLVSEKTSMRRPSPCYLLHGDFIRDLIDRANENCKSAAGKIGLSKSYFSQLLDRRRSASPAVRKKILACSLFAGIEPDALWDRIPVPERTALAGTAVEAR